MNTLQRIIYVEDDPDIQCIAKMALEMNGDLTVKTFSSGEDAIREAADFAPNLILLDVMMPGMDGPETFRGLRDVPSLSDVPVVFLSAKVQPDEIEQYIEMGASGVIPKPFNAISLADQVRAIWADKGA